MFQLKQVNFHYFQSFPLIVIGKRRKLVHKILCFETIKKSPIWCANIMKGEIVRI